MNLDIFLKIIDTIAQLILVVFAGLALSVWKREVRGKDKYRLARDLIEYMRQLRFLIHSKNKSYHQIYLNDILVDRNNFYRDQLSLIKNERVYFDQSIFDLFKHINTRSDMLLPKQIRSLVEELHPTSFKSIGLDRKQYTFIQLQGLPTIEVHDDQNPGDHDHIYQIIGMERVTIQEYFEKWEKLVIELQKLL